jgi:hypothetical protein
VRAKRNTAGLRLAALVLLRLGIQICGSAGPLASADAGQQERTLLAQHLARDREPLNSTGEPMVPP